MKKALMLLAALSLCGGALLSSCGEKHIEGSAGFTYKLSDDGTYYIAETRGTFDWEKEKTMTIGNWHDGKPVKEIASMFTYNADSGTDVNPLVDEIVVCEGITTLNFGSLWSTSAKRVVLPDGIEAIPQALCLSSKYGVEEIVFGKGIKTIDGDLTCLPFKEPKGIKVKFRGSKEEWDQIEVSGNTVQVFEQSTFEFNYKGK